MHILKIIITFVYYLIRTNTQRNPAKNNKKIMKEQLETIITDLSIVIEAIKNGDDEDAIQMLEDLKQDLKLIELMA